MALVSAKFHVNIPSAELGLLYPFLIFDSVALGKLRNGLKNDSLWSCFSYKSGKPTKYQLDFVNSPQLRLMDRFDENDVLNSD